MGIIKNWLRKNPEETLVISFMEQVEALKLNVEINDEKVRTLEVMILQMKFNMEKISEDAK